MRIIYHDDNDGRAAAAITALAGPRPSGPDTPGLNWPNLDWSGADLLPMDYSDDWTMPPVSPGEAVAVVDCMLEPAAEMVALATTASLTWIDHHASSIRAQELSPALRGATGIRSDEWAACELAWQYFHPHEPVPRAISLLGRYDRWDRGDTEAWHEQIMPLQLAVLSLGADPRTDLDLWRRLIAGEGVDDLVQAGRHIWRYRQLQNGLAARRQALEARLDGWRALAINAAGDSQLFESVWDPQRHDLMVAYSQMADRRWSFGLYSPKPEVDVSAIAEARGGGGHRDAAGFGADHLEDALELRPLTPEGRAPE